ncbi:hypothetical protein E2C01_073072 [Portunus trituberculatus]|uniref:Uncharacterized protein n=1 Tax=Portunus trituberculatus TaxID=210409 RepID=A0A5B7HZT6_PORTR|nr:hypothetical protein [Portunus trituberculatus]
MSSENSALGIELCTILSITLFGVCFLKGTLHEALNRSFRQVTQPTCHVVHGATPQDPSLTNLLLSALCSYKVEGVDNYHSLDMITVQDDASDTIMHHNLYSCSGKAVCTRNNPRKH